MSHARAAGTLGILGGVAYAAGGLRMLLAGAGEDVVTTVLGIAWAAGWIAGGWALLRLRVAGPGPFARAVSLLLLVGFAAALGWGVFRLVDPAAADRSPFAIAPVLVILGMLGTGILTLRAGTWTTWRRFLPIAIAAVYLVAVPIAIATGVSTIEYAFALAGVGYALLGDAIRRHPDRSAPIHAANP